MIQPFYKGGNLAIINLKGIQNDMQHKKHERYNVNKIKGPTSACNIFREIKSNQTKNK